jgi:3'-phosphoadenosine 5'-phosphosulfate sulfotransferase (PAPS reductase)/FAD synthetase
VTRIIVPISGGKDSQVVLSLAMAAGHNPICVHQNTGFDHPLTYQQMDAMEAFYGVKVHHTHSKYKGGMFGFLEHAGYFPNSSARGCTQRLKQEPFAKWLIDGGYNPENSEIWFGMRADESATRSSKYGALRPNDVFTLADVARFYGQSKRKEIGQIPCRLPIVDWDTARVFAHLDAEGAPVNGLYKRGHHRVGCYPCLLARKAEWLAASRDETGIQHLLKMIALEDEWATNGNHRKFLKVHRRWDVRKFLADADAADDLPEADDECGYCSI